MNASFHDSDNNAHSPSEASSNVKSSLFNLSEAGTLKINNTQLVIRPNYGKVDLKLFVGQLPKEWDDEMVSQFFSGYGEILESQIIRDGKSGSSRGCAFVKFASMTKAEEAKKMIDSKRITLPGVNNPIQIRWADGEDQRLGVDEFTIAKLFVGSIPKNANEDNLKDIFSQFGTIEELVMMRDPDNTPKGSAFVKFKNKEDAILAIRFVNGNLYMNGSDRPMEVRFAENKKKPSTAETNEHYAKPHHSTQPYTAAMPQPTGFPYYKYTAPDGTPYYWNPNTQQTQWDEPPAGSMVYPEPPGQPYVVKGAAPAVTGAKKQGPAGANLFVFHIPNEWREEDLYNQFKDFGNIISCRIMTDKQTHRSRGFGFVSYDSARAAQNAIQRMNGFQAGSKKLKVQIKKGEGDEDSGMSSSYGGNKFTPY